MKCPQCGHVADSRSTPDHRRFFARIHAAFHHWPEAHEFQPDDAEHLRAWLLCKAGYRDVTTIPVEYADSEPALLRLVTLTVEGAVKAAKGGQIEFRVEKAGIIQAGIGKASFDADKLAQNIRAFTDAVVKAKPAGAKGTYVKRVSVSSTMGPGVHVDPTSVH